MNHSDIRNRDAMIIGSFLSPAARFCADRIRVYPSLASTNLTAGELARTGAEHGTIILADQQTAGRGRLSHSFSSPSGGLYMSLILEPDLLPFREITLVTPFAGVAVCEAIREVTGKKPGIKWVNDLLLDGRKICGILSEAVTGADSGRLDRIVVGIGVNIHARPEDFPPELRSVAGSVDPDRKFPDLRNRLAAAILSRMLGYDASLSRQDLLAIYKSRLVMLGKVITVLQGSDSWQAVAMDLDSDGRLIVKKENGELVSLSSGEIRIQL